MRRFALSSVALPSVALLTIALAGCGGHATEETTRTVTKDGVTTTTITTREAGHGDAAHASAGTGLSIDSDKFKANLDIPGLTFGGDNMDLDGMKLYPGSTVKGMHVHAVDRPGTEKGEVVVDFTSPAAPAVVAQHMADEARRAGFTLAVNTAAQVGGSKLDDGDTNRFAATLSANGDGTIGQMTMTGSKIRTDD